MFGCFVLWCDDCDWLCDRFAFNLHTSVWYAARAGSMLWRCCAVACWFDPHESLTCCVCAVGIVMYWRVVMMRLRLCVVCDDVPVLA